MSLTVTVETLPGAAISPPKLGYLASLLHDVVSHVEPFCTVVRWQQHHLDQFHGSFKQAASTAECASSYCLRLCRTYALGAAT